MQEDFRIFEKKCRRMGFQHIAGIDEAGRGPLAGPVVSAAVMLPSRFRDPGIADSKSLRPEKRAELYPILYRRALSVGIGIVDPIEIDRINILRASLLSMAMAVANLKPTADCLLVDGNHCIPSEVHQIAVVAGDRRCISIAAASIIAKVTRDRLMERYDADYPQYGFGHHKGYATREHLAAIREHGCCPWHRRSFNGVRQYFLLRREVQLEFQLPAHDRDTHHDNPAHSARKER
jgi:ribonuclease HII